MAQATLKGFRIRQVGVAGGPPQSVFTGEVVLEANLEGGGWPHPDLRLEFVYHFKETTDVMLEVENAERRLAETLKEIAKQAVDRPNGPINCLPID